MPHHDSEELWRVRFRLTAQGWPHEPPCLGRCKLKPSFALSALPLGEAERSYTLEKSSTGEVRGKIERKTEEKGKRKEKTRERKEKENEGNEEKEEKGKN